MLTFLYKELSLSHLSDMNFFSTFFLTPKLRRHSVSRILFTFLADITKGRLFKDDDDDHILLLPLVFIYRKKFCSIFLT